VKQFGFLSEELKDIDSHWGINHLGKTRLAMGFAVFLQRNCKFLHLRRSANYNALHQGLSRNLSIKDEALNWLRSVWVKLDLTRGCEITSSNLSWDIWISMKDCLHRLIDYCAHTTTVTARVYWSTQDLPTHLRKYLVSTDSCINIFPSFQIIVDQSLQQ